LLMRFLLLLLVIVSVYSVPVAQEETQEGAQEAPAEDGSSQASGQEIAEAEPTPEQSVVAVPEHDKSEDNTNFEDYKSSMTANFKRNY